MKRSGKEYRKNEAEIMRALGLVPTKNSGSGWIEKEDGMNDNVICQLKSTDAGSIKVGLTDLQTLEYNASVTHKIPVFALNFLSNNSVYLLVTPQQLAEVAKYLNTGEVEIGAEEFYGISELKEVSQVSNRAVGSSRSARERFHNNNNKKYNKERKAD